MNVSVKSKLLRSVCFCFLGVVLAIPSWAQYSQSQSATSDTVQNQQQPPQDARPAQIGTINYVEGLASIDGQELAEKSVGTVALTAGQVLSTQSGKVEILLTPGVFFRLDDNSSVKMISPGLANTRLAVLSGSALVEVTDISKNNDIRIDQDDASVRLLKRGLYEFAALRNQVRVFKGKAEVYANDRKVGLGAGHEVTLVADQKLKSKGFDEKVYATTDFFRWSALRSGYLAEADADTARLYIAGGPGWYGPGWYWDPWFGAYTFIPGNGIFYSPFGWGFYSPWAVYGSPFFYGGFGWGHYHHFGDFHPPYGHGFVPRGGFHGFQGAPGAFHSPGGLHGGTAGGGFGGEHH